MPHRLSTTKLPVHAEAKFPPGYSALLRGRCSMVGSSYFLTYCLKRPHTGLVQPDLAPSVLDQMRALETRGYWHIRTAVLMPDHIHMVITLGEKLSLPEVVRSFKGPLTRFLRTHGLQWQDGYYERRLRTSDRLLPIFLYIFLNPYRARLAQPGEKWPWYECAPNDWEWFGGLTNEALRFPEWLR